MSVIVLYNGRRKPIKIAINTLIQDILTEASIHFEVDSTRCQLKHQRTILSNAQLFRYSNVPNNAQLELIVNDSISISSSSLLPAKLAISIPNGGSLTKCFDVTLTLRQVLQQLITEALLTEDVWDCNPEVIYMRMSYAGDKLDSTNLSSLGLAGQSGRLVLKLDKSQARKLSADPAIESISALPPLSVSSTSLEAAMLPSEEAISSLVENSKQIAMLRDFGDASIVPTPSLHQMATSNAHAVIAGDNQSTNMIVESEAPHTFVYEKKHLPQVLDDLLSTTFDSVSSSAVITIAKYLVNILSSQDDFKYRCINTTNSVFISKISTLPAAVDFLLSLRFEPQQLNKDGRSTLHLVLKNESFSSREQLVSCIQEALNLLYGAMDKLRVPDEERPRVKATTSVNIQPTVSLPVFDPYKPNIIRANPQPSRPVQEQSITEKKLEALQKRRLELEGNPADVDRCTEVIIPAADGSVVSMSVPSAAVVGSAHIGLDNDGDDSLTSHDKSLLARSILKSSGKGSEDGPPLTTEAIRNLQKAQREKIYSRVLIRIRFPDAVCVQGFFHPRNTISDVYDWVSSCLGSSVDSTTITSSNPLPSEGMNRKVTSSNPLPSEGMNRKVTQKVGPGVYNALGFELYTSPPRSTLVSTSIETLYDKMFVPAAVINLAWVGKDPLTSLSIEKGSYLATHLLLQADSKRAMPGSNFHQPATSSNIGAFPIGLPLVLPSVPPATSASADGKSSRSLDGLHSLDESDGSERGTAGAKGGKPKWLKF